MKHRSKKPSLTALDKVMSTFARLSGQPNERYEKPLPRHLTENGRTLSTSENKELFRKCVEFDFDYLMGQKFAATRATLQYLLPQSVLGRALNGHGWFRDDDGLPLKFSDACFDQICAILEVHSSLLSSTNVRTRRNWQIERLHHLVLHHIGQSKLPLYDNHGPLFGVEFLKEREVETVPFLQGMVLAGWMDNYNWRVETLKHRPDTFSRTPLELGGGDIFVINRKQFSQSGLSETGEQVFTHEEVNTLIKQGVIIPDTKVYDYPQYDQVYLRRGNGLGISDDLALLYIGKIYGFDAMLGAFLIDAVDSYDKFLINFRPGGMDSHIAHNIQTAWGIHSPEPLLSRKEICNLIHFAAKRNTPTTLLSSSHRRFIQYEQKADQPTLLHHWAFLEEKPLQRIKLGFARVEAEKFYNVAMERFYACGIYVKEAKFRG